MYLSTKQEYKQMLYEITRSIITRLYDIKDHFYPLVDDEDESYPIGFLTLINVLMKLEDAFEPELTHFELLRQLSFDRAQAAPRGWTHV